MDKMDKFQAGARWLRFLFIAITLGLLLGVIALNLTQF
jgi:hypothetical protein